MNMMSVGISPINPAKIVTRKWSMKTVIKVCPRCKTVFKPTRKEYVYCSVKCGAIATFGNGRMIKCENCGKEVYRTPKRFKTKHHFCDRQCYANYMKLHQVKEKNANWKGGISFIKSGSSRGKSNGRKGRYYENRTRKVLENEGFYVTRSAASKGSMDLIAVRKDQIKLVQVKSGKSVFRPKEREFFLNLQVPLNCTKELWSWKERREPEIEVL